MNILIQVPASDLEALEQLASSLGDAAELSETRPFDGEALAQVMIAISSITSPIVISWIKARAAARKSQQVIIDGRTKLNGYTPGEISKLVKSIEGLAGHDESP